MGGQLVLGFFASLSIAVLAVQVAFVGDIP